MDLATTIASIVEMTGWDMETIVGDTSQVQLFLLMRGKRLLLEDSEIDEEFIDDVDAEVLSSSDWYLNEISKRNTPIVRRDGAGD